MKKKIIGERQLILTLSMNEVECLRCLKLHANDEPRTWTKDMLVFQKQIDKAISAYNE